MTNKKNIKNPEKTADVCRESRIHVNKSLNAYAK